MAAAVNRVDVVGEAENAFGVAVVILNADFHGHAIALGFHVDRLVMQHRLAAIQVFYKFSDAAVVFELSRFSFAGF